MKKGGLWPIGKHKTNKGRAWGVEKRDKKLAPMPAVNSATGLGTQGGSNVEHTENEKRSGQNKGERDVVGRLNKTVSTIRAGKLSQGGG